MKVKNQSGKDNRSEPNNDNRTEALRMKNICDKREWMIT